MKKLKVFLLLTCSSIAFIVILFSYSNRDSNAKSGFNRKFSPLKTRLERYVQLGNEHYTFVSLTPKLITLYKFRKPSELLDISIDLKKMNEYKLPFPSKIKPYGMNSVASIGSEKFLLTGSSAKAYRINLTKHSLDSSQLDTMYFAQSEILDSNSFVITRKISHQKFLRRTLINVDWQGKKKNSYMPEKQIDGYFCTDGQFRYERNAKLLIYMFYYRGEFICLDTNMNVVYKMKTIDTVTRAKMLLKTTKNNIMVHATPPHLINKSFCVADDKIFLRSNLKADNETDKDFSRAEVIDVYFLKNGKYLYSFYLPFLEKQKLRNFSISKNILVATYKNNLAVFKIPEH